MKTMLPLFLFVVAAGCNGSGGEASPAGSAAPASSAAAPGGTAAAGAGTAAAAAAPGGGIEVLGGADWKKVFAGAVVVELKPSMGGGQGSGVADDYTRKSASPFGLEGWKYNAAGGGGVHRSPTKKVIVVGNYNIKANPTTKTIDTWIKSALVKDVKHAGEPEVLEIGSKKALGLAGAGTCTMKDGEAADFYWHDVYSAGDFAHDLTIVIIAKDAPEEEKKVALSVLRGVEYTEKAKPHYKKP